jgi:hypothetical protein
MILRFFLVVVALLFLDYPARSEEDFRSANFMLPHCRNSHSSQGRLGVLEGYCGGVIDTFVWVGSSLPPDSRFCPPKSVTETQAEAVVLKYLDAHPEQLHMNFKWLVIEALRGAWPCRNG